MDRAPDAPAPDRKDWTWTLERSCPQCGLAVGRIGLLDVADALEFAAAEWFQALTGSPAVTRRPAPAVWSPLEYGAHVRDAFVLFHERVSLMVTRSDPVFADWDQDATAIEADYRSQDPEVVAEQLVTAAAVLVDLLRELEPAERRRPGRRDNGSVFTVTTLSRYLLHDVAHHLWDVTGLRSS